jgi:hypothetical protein
MKLENWGTTMLLNSGRDTRGDQPRNTLEPYYHRLGGAVDHEHKTAFSRPDRLHDPLYVIAPVFNATRYRSRWRLYQDFAKRVAASGATLITVEAAFGDRDYAVTEAGNVYDVQLRTTAELWLKERMINLGVARLSQIDPEWTKVAWVDADIAFARDDWADETRQQLEHHPIVQLWSQAVDLDPSYEVLKTHRSFASCFLRGLPRPAVPGYHYPYGSDDETAMIHWHPGYAWAMTRDAWDHLGGLVDFAVVGNADNHMAWALLGEVEKTIPAGLSQTYHDMLGQFQWRATEYIKQNIGLVDGLILHYWHGKKRDRQYESRWKILADSGYDPVLDLKADWQLLWQLTDRSTILRDGLRRVARARNEDSIDV